MTVPPSHESATDDFACPYCGQDFDRPGEQVGTFPSGRRYHVDCAVDAASDGGFEPRYGSRFNDGPM